MSEISNKKFIVLDYLLSYREYINDWVDHNISISWILFFWLSSLVIYQEYRDQSKRNLIQVEWYVWNSWIMLNIFLKKYFQKKIIKRMKHRESYFIL